MTPKRMFRSASVVFACALNMAVSGLAPEIAHFRILGDGMDDSAVPADWYIKGARYVDSLVTRAVH